MLCNSSLRSLDIMAVVIYMLVAIGIGVFFSRRNNNTEEYFLGNRSFAGWVLGLSMVGTSISSVTFLAFPAAAFALDWRMLVINIFMPVGLLLAVFIFIPFFRERKITSVFEVLEDRFGPLARLYGAVNFILGQLLRIGVVLYLASIAISVLTGINIFFVIVTVGLIISFYTIFGGIDAVIWTDVIQTVILIAGGILSFIYIVVNLPNGLSQLVEVAGQHNKFSFGTMTWDISQRTFYTMSILSVFVWMQSYVCDQNMIQRYLAASSLKEARKAAVIACLTSIPTWIFFFLIGTGLFVYFNILPDPQIIQMDADRIFPYFILTRLPAGIGGLVIAAAIAAAMSSLDSSMNALSLVVLVDIIKRYITPSRSDKFYLFMAKIVTAITAFLMIGSAVIFHILPGESILDALTLVGSMIIGPITAIYILGFFAKRVDSRCLLVALGITIFLHVYLILNSLDIVSPKLHLAVHTYWTGIILNMFFGFLAYLLSWLIPQKAIAKKW